MTQTWNSFKRQQFPYHRMMADKEFAEDHSDNGEGPSTRAPSDEHDYYASHAQLRPRRTFSASAWRKCRFGHAVCYSLVAILCLLLGALGGQFMRLEYEIDGYMAPYGHTTATHLIPTSWQPNTTFSDEPSALTEAAWAGLIPEGRGFVTHPRLAPKEEGARMKSVSVFHELHCLHGIRTAYFTSHYLLGKARSHNSASSPHTHDRPSTGAFVENPWIENSLNNPSHLHPTHIAHCFDYLRQALQCAADSNLEDVIEKKNEEGEITQEAPGWGGTRVCRDFEGLREWSAKWRAGEGMGIL
ncbi:hypothetical protein EK21DRAFT_104617 [Setomelanomma holmii]|uniref:Tat pathway signal sequence n=1 Tax=Setomelanomma holmii TaxID=210430 RepID=A0A9P4GZF4_9PLEO|nr:hypothetical protein EK21DRAFT_104617 [Setomelanomma holmii]